MDDGRTDPEHLDDGIRDTVLLLWRAGFKTFTSCEGGKGHSFRYGTIGLTIEGTFSAFQKRLVDFLHSCGMQNFTIALVTDYGPTRPEGEVSVYLEGLDIVSPEKRRQVIENARRREQRALRRIRARGAG